MKILFFSLTQTGQKRINMKNVPTSCFPFVNIGAKKRYSKRDAFLRINGYNLSHLNREKSRKFDRGKNGEKDV